MPPLKTALLILAAGYGLAEAAEPAYLVGDRFIYERITYDAAGSETRRAPVVWEVLESTATGHRIAITEGAGEAATTAVWTFDRDHNALTQELGACRLASEPHGGRYRWPMNSSSRWSERYRVLQYCEGAAATGALQAECEVTAKVVGQGFFEGLEPPAPAIAIERVVTCFGPGGDPAGGAALRWEKELLCPTVGVRCTYEYDWIMLGPGQATPTILDAFRELPEAQGWSGRVSETLRDMELR